MRISGGKIHLCLCTSGSKWYKDLAETAETPDVFA